jgi:hypothetical protein
MKRLQRYYFLVGIPVLLLFLGVVVFFDAIANTVRGNPHPQINYVIFALFVVGSILMLMHVWRINQEGLLVQRFMDQLKSGKDHTKVSAWLKDANGSGRFDVADLLNEVLGLNGRVVGAVEHAALEAEVERFQAQQNRRLLLAQYFAGLMVGMGLFGTFIGLLGALQEIGKLIGGFAIGPGMSDPVAAVSELVTRLTEPMKAMGVAFSASLFGVLGSMVMGMLMVFVKGGAAELVSLVHSRMSWLMDLSQATGGDALPDLAVQPLQEALSELAQHSPLLKGLTLALDQSERRVRQLVESNTVLSARLEQTVSWQQSMAEQSAEQVDGQKNMVLALDKLCEGQASSLAVLKGSDARQQELTQMLAQQQQLLQQVITRESPWGEAFGQLAQSQSAQWAQLQAQWAQGLSSMSEQVHSERAQWQSQAQSQSAEQQQLVQAVLSMLQRNELAQIELGERWQQRVQQQADAHAALASLQNKWADLLDQAQQQLTTDSQQRLELAERSRQGLTEMQARQEQLFHAVLGHKA